MAISLATWNLGRAFDNDALRAQALEGIDRLNADIIVLPEVFSDEDPEVVSTIKDLGYTSLAFTEYIDDVPRDYLQYIVVGSRLSDSHLTLPRLATRQAVGFSVTDPDNSGTVLSGIGVHMDDRSSALREEMAEALVYDFDVDLALGDFNDMHAGNLMARAVRNRFVRAAAHRIPGGLNPHIDEIKSLATRLSEMGDGGVMKILLDEGFMDADSVRHSTMLVPKLGIPFGQLDHILYRGNLLVTNFEAHDFKCSDHKAISATVRQTHPEIH